MRRIIEPTLEELKKSLKSVARYFGLEISKVQRLPNRITFDEAMDYDYGLLRGFATRVAQFSASPAETQAVRNLLLTGILNTQPYAGYFSIEVGGAHTPQVGDLEKKKRGQRRTVRSTARSQR